MMPFSVRLFWPFEEVVVAGRELPVMQSRSTTETRE